jgi:hypothetical protein
VKTPPLRAGLKAGSNPSRAFAPSPGRKVGDLSRMVCYGRITVEQVFVFAAPLPMTLGAIRDILFRQRLRRQLT